MAKKSKTQKAKAAAARAARKAAKAQAEQEAALKASMPEEEKEPEPKVKKIFKKKEEEPVEKTPAQLRQERRDAKMAAKENKAPKKHGKIVQFFIDVKAELKRVTWPDKKDVGQWTGVVIGALCFFGAYVAILDNLVVTPILLWIASFSG